MASTKTLWTFDENDVGIFPIDLVGNVEPLAPMGDMPQLVPGLFGNARRFGGSKLGYIGQPTVAGFAGEVALRRSMTFEALLRWDGFTNATEIIAQYGNNSTAGDRTTWAFGIHDIGGLKTLKASWARIGGALAVVPELPVSLPTGWIYLVAVREWSSASLAYVHWYINGQLVGTVTSTEADIENGENAFVYVGSAAGMSIFSGDIDTVRLSEGVRTPEEIRQFYRRLFVYGGYGYELIRSLLPPGEAYSSSPTSFVQRELMVAGDALGFAWAKLAELAEDFLPDRAWSELERWEDVTGLAPAPSATIDERRARVLAFLRKVHGYSRSDIKLSVAELLKADPDDLLIVENSNTYTEDFGAPLSAFWTLQPSDGSLGVAGGILFLDHQIGDNVRHDDTARRGVLARTPLATHKFPIQMAQIDMRAMPNGTFVGLIRYETVVGHFELFGMLTSVGVTRFFHRLFDATGEVDTLGDPVPADPIWLRFEQGHCEYGTSGYDGPWIEAIPSIPSPSGDSHDWNWCGIVLGSDIAPTTAVGGIDVLDYRIFQPRWEGVWQWYLYRDPTMAPTDYDLEGAQLVINKVRPAHTEGTVIEALVALCDDPFTLCDRDPLGV